MSQDRAPLVAVTGPVRRLKFGWWAARIQLSRAGLRAVYITAENPTLPNDVCGIVIGGGDDIDPVHYGAVGTAGVNYDPARDELEIDVIKFALKNELPMLGICRGSQLINVVYGGSLYADIRPLRKLTPNRNSLFPIKQADLKMGTKLSEIYQTESVMINSLHSQAVEKLGKGLSAVAHDRDGFIQAVEDSEKRFLIGVQWHPEYLLFQSEQTRLFRAFAKEVRIYAADADT